MTERPVPSENSSDALFAEAKEHVISYLFKDRKPKPVGRVVRESEIAFLKAGAMERYPELLDWRPNGPEDAPGIAPKIIVSISLLLGEGRLLEDDGLISLNPKREVLNAEMPETRFSESFDELLGNVVSILEEAKEKYGSVGYVAGIITSDGPDFYERNKKILSEKTRTISAETDYPVFCANDIFSNYMVDKLGHRNEDYIDFWTRLLKSGVVTDIFMTERWDESTGATEEHKTAKEIGINIHFEND